MRTEQEMLNIIMGTAREDERIRVVIMNGSRANSNVKKDLFQDYDIVYIVRDIDSFTADQTWVEQFGERVMMQMPEAKVVPPAENRGHFIYLMQFTDGNRIDLTLIPVEKMSVLLKPDSLSVLLLDKDGLIGSLPPSNDSDYHIKPPTEQEFADMCNEFWWICLNISKGLWRHELTYTMFMYEQINRNVLIRMIEWSIGIDTNFAKSAGKIGKYFEDYLSKEEWDGLVSTYPGPDYSEIWNSLFKMCDLYRKFAVKVADHFDFEYPYGDDRRVVDYLEKVRKLPRDALTL